MCNSVKAIHNPLMQVHLYLKTSLIKKNNKKNNICNRSVGWLWMKLSLKSSVTTIVQVMIRTYRIILHTHSVYRIVTWNIVIRMWNAEKLRYTHRARGTLIYTVYNKLASKTCWQFCEAYIRQISICLLFLFF